MIQHKVIFLDRDGVINKEVDYLSEINKFVFIDGIFDAMKKFSARGYKFIVITNQSGISRGFYSINDFEKLTSWMYEKFKENGIEILDLFFCPHVPEDFCECRKPKPGLFFQAINKYNIDLSKSWMIGDSERDIIAAKSAGIDNTVLVRTGHPIDERNSSALFILDSINEINKLGLIC